MTDDLLTTALLHDALILSVMQEPSQEAWAHKHGVDKNLLNKVLEEKRAGGNKEANNGSEVSTPDIVVKG